ncbi:NEAT domain-containing protein [Virgibacillus pantothenticus]|uniref:NEAT domain-containing protein n=1 Tax=Virgibacillus pantothenticus TaxID=1473 RepID=UPI000986F9D2|nr:NEAT domain-containing protein [Virgibacillus pantothenticus]
MKKLVSILLMAFLMLMTVTSTLSPVAAAETNEKVFTDGEYELPFVVWKENEDNTSVADDYLQKPAKLIVQNGKYTVQTTLKNSSWWQYFKVENNGKFMDVSVISENKEEDTRVVQFDVPNLEEMVNAKVHIIVTGIPGFKYDNKYNIRFKFDPSNIPLIEKPADPEKPTPEEPNKDTNTPAIIEVDDGNYTIEVASLHAKEDKPSGMSRYIDKTASLSVKDGKTLLTLTLNDHRTITGFQVDGKEPIEENINEAKNWRKVTYELNHLATIMNANVQYKVESHQGDQPLRLSFNQNSLKEVEVKQPDKEQTDPNQNLNEKPEVPNNQSENSNKQPKKQTKQPTESNKKIDPKNLKDGSYSIAYKVLKNNTNQVSVMNDYVVSPGHLKVKNGEKKIAITLKNSSWITDFKVYHEGKLVDPKVLSHDSKVDTRVVEFAVDNLFTKLDVWVKVDIPNLNYHHEYDVQFQFDPNSIQLLKEGESYPQQENVDATKLPSKKQENKEEQGPSFDRNEDHGDKQNLATTKETGKQTNNPTTSDTAKLVLFTSLLLGSLIPLVIKLRKKYVQ